MKGINVLKFKERVQLIGGRGGVELRAESFLFLRFGFSEGESREEKEDEKSGHRELGVFFQKVALRGGSLEGAYRDGIDYLINLSGFPTDLH